MEKKVRIQLFADDGAMMGDRLVSQDAEFNVGPKVQHKGPLRIEFSLLEKTDIERAKEYLDKLVGNLPIEKKKEKKLKVLQIVDSQENLVKLVEQVKSLTNQDEVISMLRELGFKFITWDHLSSLDLPLTIKEVHQDKYQWMIRCIKPAKNPLNDKFDPMLIFGIKLLGERSDKIVVYLDGSFKESFNVPIPSKVKFGYDKTDILVFPKYMIQEERDRFRYEYRLHENDPEKEPSKFFKRWYEHVGKPKDVLAQGNKE